MSGGVGLWRCDDSCVAIADASAGILRAVDVGARSASRGLPGVFWPALALVLGFTAWCVWLVQAVEHERAEVSTRVSWLGEAQALQHTLGRGGEIDGELRGLVEEVEAGAAGAAVRSALLAVQGTALATARHEALDGFVRAVRGETAALSLRLGQRWSALYVLTLVALLSAVTVLALLVVATRRQRQAEALQASLAEAMRAVDQARGEAVAASVNKSAYVAHMSHELRTPLNAILGYTALLRELPTVAADPEAREDLQRVALAGEHILGLIDAILDIARIEAGRLELKPAPFEPRALIESVVELLRGQAREGVTLRVEAGPELPARLIGDAARLRQVLVNLVANALRFTARGSVVIRVSEGSSGLRVVVEDTGPGISSEGQALLFRPFSQLDGGDGRGSGVGLMLCRQLIEAMGGRIDVESEPGVGSRFWFVVPLATA